MKAQVISVSLALLLAACGGGGGDSGSSSPTGPDTSATAPGNDGGGSNSTDPGTPTTPPGSDGGGNSTDPGTPTTPPSNDGGGNSTDPGTPTTPPGSGSRPTDLVPGAELAPTQAQPSSTASDPGAGYMGYYSGFWGPAFVDTNAIATFGMSGGIFGSIAPTADGFTLGSDAIQAGTFSKSVSGSATYVFQKNLALTITGASTNPTNYTYDPANMLAVSLADVVGSWSMGPSAGFAYKVSVTVDNSGNIQGTTVSTSSTSDNCLLTGQISQLYPATGKNLYSMTLSATPSVPGGRCGFGTTSAYQGMAAIGLSPAGIYVSNGYFRQLTFAMRTADGSSWQGAMQKN